jgi:hypothetical protein
MTIEQKGMKNNLRLLKLAETSGNVSHACKALGYSRDSFYPFKQLYEGAWRWACWRSVEGSPVPRTGWSFMWKRLW